MPAHLVAASRVSATPMFDDRLHPLVALRAIRTLFAHPEDTRQVFTVIRAMRGRSGLRMMQRFRASATGAALLASRPPLLATLCDQTLLSRMADGSLGRCYLAFMRSERLSADGLAAMSDGILTQAAPEAAFFSDRMRDQHDLQHVLTGYGREPLGEICLLAFNHAQSGNLGMAMIAGMAVLRYGRGSEARIRRAAVWEAWTRGRRAAWLGEQHWEQMLAAPLDSLRATLHLAPAPSYQAARAGMVPA